MTPSMEDHIAIQNLLYRYADAADRRDAKRMNGCFANGQVRITGPGIVVDDGEWVFVKRELDVGLHDVTVLA